MKISDNIHYILTSDNWSLFTNKCCRVSIQKGHISAIYNVPEKPGIVYNYLEDCFEPINDSCYVITGIAGEMWPVSLLAISKYKISADQITDEPQEVYTVPTGTVYAGICIPSSIPFTLEVDYGQTCILKGNRKGIGHSSGDWILLPAKLSAGRYLPDFQDAGRIINGTIFNQLYAPYSAQ